MIKVNIFSDILWMPRYWNHTLIYFCRLLTNIDLLIPKSQQENDYVTPDQWSIPYPLVSVVKSQSSWFCYSQEIFDSPSLEQSFFFFTRGLYLWEISNISIGATFSLSSFLSGSCLKSLFLEGGKTKRNLILRLQYRRSPLWSSETEFMVRER